MKIIDISLPITADMPVYPGTAATKIKTVKSGSGTSVLSEITMTSHAGTHVDAPVHSIEEAPSLQAMSLDKFYGPTRVIDLSSSVQSITADDLKTKNIQPGERVLLKTSNSSRGFSKFYDDYVYLSAEAADYLAQIGVKLVGIDALSVKKRGDPDNSSHTLLLSRGIAILEGLDLSRPAEGSYMLSAFPIALQFDGAPTRAVLISDVDSTAKVAISDSKDVKLYTDGGSRGNPGASAIAYVICRMDDTVVEKSGKYLGITTNNQAEYQALLMGLTRCLEVGFENVHVFMDSELVVKQIKGLYKMKNADLKPHYDAVKRAAEKFKEFSINHVPRNMNKLADAEVNRILDSKT